MKLNLDLKILNWASVKINSMMTSTTNILEITCLYLETACNSNIYKLFMTANNDGSYEFS